jgi:hypothetical protein
MMYAIEIASCGMLYLSSFMKIVTGIQAVLKVLPQQFERL